jgi:lysyl-tRNA synthetase class II
MQDLSEQEIQRRESTNKLREMGINPFPAALYPVSHLSADLKKNFEEGKKVIIAGRLMARRTQGKASFAELQDHPYSSSIVIPPREVDDLESESSESEGASTTAFGLVTASLAADAINSRRGSVDSCITISSICSLARSPAKSLTK